MLHFILGFSSEKQLPAILEKVLFYNGDMRYDGGGGSLTGSQSTFVYCERFCARSYKELHSECEVYKGPIYSWWYHDSKAIALCIQHLLHNGTSKQKLSLREKCLNTLKLLNVQTFELKFQSFEWLCLKIEN